MFQLSQPGHSTALWILTVSLQWLLLARRLFGRLPQQKGRRIERTPEIGLCSMWPGDLADLLDIRVW